MQAGSNQADTTTSGDGSNGGRTAMRGFDEKQATVTTTRPGPHHDAGVPEKGDRDRQLTPLPPRELRGRAVPLVEQRDVGGRRERGVDGGAAVKAAQRGVEGQVLAHRQHRPQDVELRADAEGVADAGEVPRYVDAVEHLSLIHI